MKPLNQTVNLALGYLIIGGKASHRIGHLITIGDHFDEVCEKVDVVGILKANPGLSEPVK